MTRALNRRQALARLGTVSLGTLLAACGDGGDGGSATVTTTDGATATVEPGSATSDGLAARFDDAASCALTVEQTEGPYYFDADAIRRDIREDREGVRLRLGLRVGDAGSCEPLPNAVVDIWHCDAGGVYSGFESASTGGPGGGGRSDEERYLRGAQVTDADGIAEFATIYPGWYTGRTPHIHAKVHLDRETLLTSQLYFDERTSAAVYAREPYAARGAQDQPNATDGIFDPSLVLTLSEDGDGYLGLMTFDVRRA